LTVESLEDRLVPTTLVPIWPGGHQPIHHPGQTWLSITGVPAQVTAGGHFAVTVTDYDVNTGAVAAYSGSVVLTENSGGYYGTAWPLGAVTLNNGVGTATVAPIRAGAVTIIADAGYIGYAGTDVRGESGGLVVNPGPAVSLAVTAPGTALQGVPFATSFTAQDAYGNTATSYNQTIALCASDGQAVTPAAVPMSHGIGSANLTLRNAGAVDLIAGAAGVTGKAHLTVVSPISALSTTVGYAPGYSSQYLQTGSEVDVTGQDFQPGAKVIFGNPGTNDPQTLLQMANQAGVGASASINSSGTWLSVQVPRYAVNGPIAVIDPDGTCLLSPQTFTVHDYRETFGFSFQNYNFDITWGMMQECFGTSQTNISSWTPFGEVVSPVPNPVAVGIWGLAAAGLNGNGACFGMALATLRLQHHPELFSQFTSSPAGATINSLSCGSTLERFIDDLHLVQISSEMIHYWAGWVARAAVGTHSAQDIRSQIEGLLAAGNPPMISVQGSLTEGHAMVAYGVEPGDGKDGFTNDYYIDVYDPNRPSGMTEMFNIAMHESNDQGSRIHVSGTGQWIFHLDSQTTWQGGLGTLMVIPYDQIPEHPSLPTSLSGLTHLVLGEQGTATAIGPRAGMLAEAAWPTGPASAARSLVDAVFAMWGAPDNATMPPQGLRAEADPLAAFASSRSAAGRPDVTVGSLADLTFADWSDLYISPFTTFPSHDHVTAWGRGNRHN
jgi:hypothetical protein